MSTVTLTQEQKTKIFCPFCEGDKCCFCDYTGKVSVGENEIIKSVEHSKSGRMILDIIILRKNIGLIVSVLLSI